MPASYVYPLPPPSNSEERLDFICFILEKETGINYSCHEILFAHNILMGNNDIQEQLNLNFGRDKLQQHLSEYKRLQPASVFASSFSPLLLLPHRTICIECNAQLKNTFQTSASVIYCAKVQSCLLYKADCHGCRKIVSSFIDLYYGSEANNCDIGITKIGLHTFFRIYRIFKRNFS